MEGTGEKTASVAFHPPRKTTEMTLGLNPGFQGEKPATNRLIYTKVFFLVGELIIEG
jgi:hypothetical protein